MYSVHSQTTVASGSFCACTKLAATLSNCGNTLKFLVPNINRKIGAAENELWYGKNPKNEALKAEMGNPQPTPKGTYGSPLTPPYCLSKPPGLDK
jgi:hypothetical protein